MTTMVTTRNKKKCIQAVRLCCLCFLVIVTFRWIARANIRLDEVSTYISKSHKVTHEYFNDDEDVNNNDVVTTTNKNNYQNIHNDFDRVSASMVEPNMDDDGSHLQMTDTTNTSMRGVSNKTTNESDGRTAQLLEKDMSMTMNSQLMMKFEKSAPTRKFQNEEAEIRFMQRFRDDLISGKIDRSKQQQEDNENRPRIVHIWSPYAVTSKGKKENPFYPLDQAQNVTWLSLYEAQQDYNRYNSDVPLHIYCAVLWMDVQVIQDHHPPLCMPGKYNHLLVLNRSSYTEYPSLEPSIHYPFIQDIFTAALNDLQTVDDNDDGKTDWGFDYMIYTNSDIAVIKYFYTLISKAITTFHYDAFVVDRRTIPRKIGNVLLTSNNLPQIERNAIRGLGKFHPGTDCFVMEKSIITNINLGDMFLGSPPWARVLVRIVKNHLAYRFHIFKSMQQYGWTYHLGDERTWNDRPEQEVVSSKEEANNITWQCCYPYFYPTYPQHWFQNTLNCAVVSKNFTEAKKHLTQLLSNTTTTAEEAATMMVDISSKVNDDSIVPAFIVNGNDLEMKKRFYQVTAKNIDDEFLYKYERHELKMKNKNNITQTNHTVRPPPPSSLTKKQKSNTQTTTYKKFKQPKQKGKRIFHHVS